jgi:DNA-binding GntR family transcriptional regulator
MAADAIKNLAHKAAAMPRTVADHVADVLREAIAGGSLRAGTVLRQDELARQFQFSRMPVRDALRQLEAEGLVSIHPTRGAFVAGMDRGEIAEIYAVRELLEAEALRLAFPSLGEVDLAAAGSALDQIDGEPDVARWGLLNRAFHLALYRPCGNARLLALIEAQHNASDRYVRILLSNLNYRSRSQAEHRRLLALCRRHERETALKLLKQHLREGSAALVKFVK